MLRLKRCWILLNALFLYTPAAQAADWPQWLGPQRNGVSAETGLLTAWPESGPKIMWRTSLGNGFSAVSIADRRAYTMYADSTGEFAVCLNASSGGEIWRFRTGDYYQERQGGDGPRSTPTVEGDRVYVLGARGHLFSLGTADGKKVWEKDLTKEFGSQVPKWGFSTSPLIEGDLLLIEVGGVDGNVLVDMVVERETTATAVAVEKATGNTVWTALDDKMSYSSPIAFSVNAVRQAVFFNAYALVGLAPQSGKVHWRFPWKTRWDVSAPTPVHIPPNRIFISAGDKSAVVRLTPQKDGVAVEEIWQNSEMKNHFGTSIYYQGHLYGFDQSILKCIDATTGTEQWKTRGYGKGSLIIADGHLVILGEQGNLGMALATPEAFREMANMPIMNGRCWTVPALADGKLYLRDESEVVCLDMKGS